MSVYSVYLTRSGGWSVIPGEPYWPDSNAAQQLVWFGRAPSVAAAITAAATGVPCDRSVYLDTLGA